MADQKFIIVRVAETHGISPYLTAREVACRCGVHPELIDRFIRLGLIDATDRDADGEALFQHEVLAIVRRILRIRNQLGVNYAGVGVVLELMARIESLEANIRELERRLMMGE